MENNVRPIIEKIMRHFYHLILGRSRVLGRIYVTIEKMLTSLGSEMDFSSALAELTLLRTYCETTIARLTHLREVHADFLNGIPTPSSKVIIHQQNTHLAKACYAFAHYNMHELYECFPSNERRRATTGSRGQIVIQIILLPCYKDGKVIHRG